GSPPARQKLRHPQPEGRPEVVGSMGRRDGERGGRRQDHEVCDRNAAALTRTGWRAGRGARPAPCGGGADLVQEDLQRAARAADQWDLAQPGDEPPDRLLLPLVGGWVWGDQPEFEGEVVAYPGGAHDVVLAAAGLAEDGHLVREALRIAEHHVQIDGAD